VNKLMHIFLLFITLVVTVFLFFFIVGDKNWSDLFYINLVDTCFIEMIFFGYLGVSKLNWKSGTGAIKSILGGYSSIYIVSNLIVMLTYSLVINRWVPLVIYVSSLIIITLIWVIIGYITIDADAAYGDQINELRKEQHDIRYFIDKMSSFEQICLSIYNEKGFVFRTESSNATTITPLVKKFQHLTPNVIRDFDADVRLQQILDSCGNLLEELRIQESIDPVFNSKMQKFTSESIAEIDFIKSKSKA
jgi:hypothetical protein